jgi:putative flippase GtrA
MIGGGLVNYAVFALLVYQLSAVNEQPAWGVAAGSLAGMGFNFLSSRKMVFRQSAKPKNEQIRR